MTGFLVRLAARAAVTQTSIAPKGLLNLAASPNGEEQEAARLEEPEDEEKDKAKRLNRVEKKDEEPDRATRNQKKDQEKEEVKSLRRAASKDEEEAPSADAGTTKEEQQDAQPLRRAETDGPEEEQQAKPLRRAKAVEQKDEEDAQTRRATKAETEKEEPEAAAQALRRAEAGDKDNEEDEAKALRRAPRMENQDEAPRPEETREIPEPNQLTALRREPAHGAAAPVAAPPTQDGFATFASPGLPPARHADSFERATVQIDRLDVIVQEPAGSAAGGGLDRSRSIRARYLRRL